MKELQEYRNVQEKVETQDGSVAWVIPVMQYVRTFYRKFCSDIGEANWTTQQHLVLCMPGTTSRRQGIDKLYTVLHPGDWKRNLQNKGRVIMLQEYQSSVGDWSR